MYKRWIFLSLLTIAATLSADVEDKFKINIGTMLVTGYETEMLLTPKNLPLSVRINTEDQLGMESETNVFRLDGYYRFSDTHSIDISYFSVKSEGNKVLSADIEWDDKTIGVGTTVSSYFNMDVYKINYGYSFYHNEKVELVLSAGFHITTLDLGLEATGVTEGDEKVGITVPLPTFGFKGEYTVIDKRLFVEYKTDYFFLKYDDFQGRLISSALNIEYRFVDNIGVGVGYNSNKIFVAMDDGNKRFEAENDLSGVMFYMTYVY